MEAEITAIENKIKEMVSNESVDNTALIDHMISLIKTVLKFYEIDSKTMMNAPSEDTLDRTEEQATLICDYVEEIQNLLDKQIPDLDSTDDDSPNSAPPTPVVKKKPAKTAAKKQQKTPATPAVKIKKLKNKEQN